jgi:hypothetical protein
MLGALIAAQDALARLEAETAMVPAVLRDGLGARMAVREAAGWLAHQGSWVHPVDLALREAGVTGSYAAAELGMRLPSVLPATVAEGGEDLPEDRDVAAALGHARRWRRLAVVRSWAPEDMALPEAEEPALLGAARIVAATAEGRSDRFSAAAVLRAAWLWRERGGTGDPGLPLWSAPVGMLHRLALAPTEAGVLGAVAEAATAGRRELARLISAAGRLQAGARGRLDDAVAEALRRPVLTGRMLAAALGISQRGAFDLIGRMQAAGLLREATGRRAWRAFVIAERVR